MKKTASRDAKRLKTQQYLCLIISPLGPYDLYLPCVLDSPIFTHILPKGRVAEGLLDQGMEGSEKLRTLPKVTQLIKEQRQDWNSSFPGSPTVLFPASFSRNYGPESCLFLFWCHLEIQPWFSGYQVLLSVPKHPSLMHKISLMTHE